ncbi:MAG: TonB-dependent receptor [Deltaproteobacteria bacterium]|jgi:vitamin B12 transporter|nr:TonB-dependent receptor [Deltaproteobacteria bacterium]
MNNYFTIILGLVVVLVLSIAPGVYAQSGSVASTQGASSNLDPIVVIGTLDEQSLSESTKSVSVVTSDDINAQANSFLPKYLSQLPGVFYSSNGGLGQWTAVNVRGAGAKYTAFEFNGIPLQDVADTQGAFTGFLEDLQGTGNVNQVELLRGSSSALHGSRAIGGVISIQTDRWINGIKAELRNEFGPYNTYLGSARIAYGQPDLFYIDVSPVYTDTDGPKYGYPQGLGYKNKGASFTAGFKPFEGASLELVSMFYDSKMLSSDTPAAKIGLSNQISDMSGIIPQHVDNPNDRRESEVSQIGLNWHHKVSNLWDYSLVFSYGETERHYFTEVIGGMDKGFYDGQTKYFKMQHNFHPSDWLTINTGIEHQNLKYIGLQTPYSDIGIFSELREDYDYKSWEYYVQFQGFFLDRKLVTNVGGRYSKFDIFSGEFLYDISAAYTFDTKTKIHAQVGAGYRAPSLFELHGGGFYRGAYTHYGDENLSPEKSSSFEVGIEQQLLNDRMKLGVTYFQTDVDDIIYFETVTSYGYAQGSKGKVKGLEASVNYWLLDQVRLTAAYTYVDSKFKADPRARNWTRTLNLPHNIFNFNVLAYPTDKMSVSANLAVRGKTPVSVSDVNWRSYNYEEGSSVVLDVAASYQVFDFVKLFLRVDNVTDTKYTVGAYYQPGVSVYGGVTFSYR